MATGKKFYWLKLSRDFFKRHDIRIIESQENGKDYVLFYLKLLVESIDHEGQLRFSDTVPYDEKMLSIITNTNIDVVRQAIRIFTELKLMHICDDKTIFMKEMDKLLGYETDWAKKKREQRNTKELVNSVDSGDIVPNVSPNSPYHVLQEIEIEKELEKDKEKSIINNTKKEKVSSVEPKKIYGEYRHVRLTESEYEKLKLDFPKEYKTMISNLDEYLEMKNVSYKNHNLTMRKWKNKEKEQTSVKKKPDVSIGWLDEYVNEQK